MLPTTLTFLLATALAVPIPKSNHTFSPPPLFTVAAFQLPYPPNSTLPGSLGISGIPLTALGGTFWINPNRPTTTIPTVLFVDIYGQAFLVREVFRFNCVASFGGEAGSSEQGSFLSALVRATHLWSIRI
jgi:hypothetical protein